MNDTNSRWQVVAASVSGRDHRRIDRPCQDAFAIRRAGLVTVAVVSDGCGSGAHSELGARLGANVLATALAASLAAGASVHDPAPWDAACDAVLARLADLAPVLGAELGDAIREHLLFTLVAAAVTPDGAAILAIGDGVVIVDGVVQVLDAGPDNAPPYLAYELLGRAPERLRIAAPGARELVLATDGAVPIVGDLAALDDRTFANRDMLRRRLAIAGRVPGLLLDDTTVVAIRQAS